MIRCRLKPESGDESFSSSGFITWHVHCGPTELKGVGFGWTRIVAQSLELGALQWKARRSHSASSAMNHWPKLDFFSSESGNGPTTRRSFGLKRV